MIRTGLAAIVIAAVAFAAPAVRGQPAPPENGDGRFSFHRADDGYMRLDQKTGEVSKCIRRAAGWQCQVVPDERAALEAEIARLQVDNAVLKKELLTRNIALPAGIRPEPPAPAPGAQQHSETRNEARLRRVMYEINKVWRRIVEMIASVQRDLFNRT